MRGICDIFVKIWFRFFVFLIFRIKMTKLIIRPARLYVSNFYSLAFQCYRCKVISFCGGLVIYRCIIITKYLKKRLFIRRVVRGKLRSERLYKLQCVVGFVLLPLLGPDNQVVHRQNPALCKINSFQNLVLSFRPLPLQTKHD